MKINSITQKYVPATSNVVKDKNKEHKNNAIVAAASLAGSVASVLAISKITKGKFSFDVFDPEASLKSFSKIAAVSGASIVGGLLGGFATSENKEEKEFKAKESLFQFTKIIFPTAIVMATLKGMQKAKFNETASKILSPIIGIGIGMPLAQKTSEKISKKAFGDDAQKMPERKIKIKDYLVHVDDLLTLLIVTGSKFATAIQADKILPLIYAYCGYESGTKSSNDAKEEKTDKLC